MTDADFIQNLGIIVLAAAAFSLLGRWLGLPSIVSFLVAGLVLGPLTGLMGDSEALRVLTDAGIILLLFLVGLELTVDRIREVGRPALITGSAQIGITLGLGFGLALALGFAPAAAALVAAALTISSTVVVVKSLVERDESSSGHGQAAIGILLVQDIFVILLMTVITGLGDGEDGADVGAVAGGLLRAFAGMLGLMAAMFVAARYLLPRPFAWAGRSRETVFIWSLSWCFLVVLGAHFLHLSHEIGAFLAGVSIAQSPHSHDLQRRVRPLMNFFVALFFVTLGIGMRLDVSAALWLQVGVFSVFVVVGKLLIVVWITARQRFAPRRAFLTALLLTQISEFSFILAAMAAQSGLATTTTGDVLALVGVITIIVSSLLIGYRDALFRIVRDLPPLRGLRGDDPGDGTDGGDGGGAAGYSGHIIIVGMNTLGRDLARRLVARGETVVATDVDPGKLRDLPCHTLHGDAEAPPVLREAGLKGAKLLISTLHIESTNDLLAFRCKAAGVPAAIHVANLREVANLLDMGVAYMMVPKVDGIQFQSAELTRRGLLKP